MKTGDHVFVLHDGSHDREPAVVVAIETNHVLLEMIGKVDRWNEPLRQWVARARFVSEEPSFCVVPSP